jgi:hypothetical protein
MENTVVLHHHNQVHPDSPRTPGQVYEMKKADDISFDNHAPEPPVQQLASATLEDGKGHSV